MKNSRIKNNGKQSLWPWAFLSALGAGFVLLIIYAIQGFLPGGENLIIRNDAIAQYNPILIELSERIKEGSGLLFSWQSGFGVNFYATMLYYLVNPFNLTALVFKTENMTSAFALIIFLTTMFISFCTSVYLQKHFKKSDVSTIAFSIIYTFCGFYLCNYYNIMWLMSFALLPLVLLGIEKIIEGKSGLLYCFSLFAAIICNFYLAFMICIFSVIYFFVCLFSKPINKKTDKREKKETLFPVLVKFGAFSLLAGGMAAFTLLPIINSLGGSYIKNAFAFTGSYFFNISDFISMHTPGIVPDGMTTTQHTLPAVCMAAITSVLIPLYWFIKKIPVNKKIAYSFLLVLLWLSFNIPAIYYVWHGLSSPACLPYRFAFIYCFVLMQMAYEVFVNIKEIPKWSLIATAAVNIGLYATTIILFAKNSGLGYGFSQMKPIYISAGFMLVNFALILILRLVKNKRTHNLITALILIVLIAEIPLLDSKYFYIIGKDAQFGGYRAEVEETVAEIDKNDNGFYRMDFAYPSGTLLKGMQLKQEYGMTPSLYGYNGVTQFSSLANSDFSLMQYTVGNYGNTGNAYAYSMQTPIYNTLFGIKYVMDNVGYLSEENIYYQKVCETASFDTYQNKNYLGMGMVANSEILEWNPFNANPFAVQSSLWETATAEKGAFNIVAPEAAQYYGCREVSYDEAKATEDIIFDGHQHEEGEEGEEGEEHEELSGSVYDLMENLGNSYMYKIENEKDFSISYTFKAEKSQEFYLSANSGALKQIEVSSTDGEDFSVYVPKRCIVNLGYHNQGDTIKITLKLNGDDVGEITDEIYDDVVYITVAGFNNGAYESGINTLKQNGVLEVTDFEETCIKGTVNASKDGVMMMSMPQDSGWTILVDGEETEQLENEADILMFNVSKGEHIIEMKFFPSGLKEGLFVSGASVFALVLVLALIKLRKNKKDEPVEIAEEENLDADFVREQNTRSEIKEDNQNSDNAKE